MSPSSASQCCARYGPIASWTGFRRYSANAACLACPRRRSWSSLFGEAESIPATRALPAFLQEAYLANLVTAAVRLIRLPVKPMGSLPSPSFRKSEGVGPVSAQAKKAMIDDLGSAAFMVDLASMEHETQYTRTGDLAPTLVARALSCSTCFNPCQAPLALPWRKPQDGHRYYCVLSRCRVQKPGS